MLLLGACSADVTGPKPDLPEVKKSAARRPVDPGIVCNAQHVTKVTLHGEGLSPVPIGIPKDPRAALPTVELSREHDLDGGKVGKPELIVWSGDPATDPTNATAKDGTPLLTWVSREKMTFNVTPELTLQEGKRGMLPDGVYDVAVRNANGDHAVSVGALAVVPMPSVTKTSPSVVCVDQTEQTITLTGQTFLRIEDQVPVLQVEGVDDEPALELSDCEKIAHAGISAERCATAKAKLSKGFVGTGYPTLVVKNPKTADCSSEDEIHLRVVPKPTIDHVAPALGCVAQGKRTFVIEGKDFLKVDGALPNVTIADVDVKVTAADGCETLETMGAEVETCSSLEVSVAEDELEPGLLSVVVRNPDPAGCDAIAEGAVRIVPPPSLQEVVPPLVCLDDGPRALRAQGEDFLVVDGAPPKVTVDGEVLDADAITAEDCEDLKVPGLAVKRCAALVLAIGKHAIGLGSPDVSIENPTPAGCIDTHDDLLRVVPGPKITSATPALVCTDDAARAITITGTGFIELDGDTTPTVTIGGAATTVTSLSGCTTVEADGVMVKSCTTIDVSVAQGALSAGNSTVVVANPDPAGCSATRADVLTIPPMLAISAITPLNVCQGTVNTAFPVELSGTGFLRVDGSDFTVKVGGNVVTPTDIPAADCSALSVVGLANVSSCNTIDLSIDLTGLTAAPGTIAIDVDNMHVPGCPASASTALNVVAPPSVSDAVVVGNALAGMHDACSDTSFTLQITGTDFVPGASVKLSSSAQTFTASSVSVTSSTSLTATFTGGLPYDASDSSYDLIVENAGNCASSALVDLIKIDPTPLVFFVDPPIAYNKITIDATVFTSGLSAASALDTIALVGPAGGTSVATELAVISNPKPNRIVARIPGIDSGTSQPTFAAGDYAVRVTSTLGCVGTLDGGLKITDTLDGTLLSAITPSFVSPTKPTAVTVTGAGFMAVPRLYLTPSGSTGTAIALRSVELNDATKLTAVIPGDAGAALVAGTYDLVAVNPNGKVDVLANAVTVTSDDPPVIDSVVPASLVSTSTGTVSVHGSGFDAATVVLVCKPPTGANVMISGVLQGTPTATDVQVSLNVGASGAGAGSVCLVRLTNVDGSSFDFSALSLTNSSLNLSPWVATTNMVEARRALSLAAGRPTNASRFLYALGGDAGAASNTQTIGSVRSSVEAANVDVFGTIGAWSLQRNDLTHVVIGGVATSAPRTAAASARVGRFLYLVGGYESGTTKATDTLLRAQVLDPLATPEIEDLDAQLGDAELSSPGLPGGLYYYRVAAIFTDGDASNPGGESLPGELLPVQLPDRPEGILLTLTWQPVVGAHGYRIYRSPVAGASAGAVELLSEKTCAPSGTGLCDCTTTPAQCKLTDDNLTATTSGKSPMPSGSLGVWHAVDGARCTTANCNLGTVRESHAAVAVKNPSNAAQYFLYAIGGRNAAGTYLSSYEVATLTIASDGSQTVADWTAGADTLSSPRAELGAWVMSADNSSVIGNSGTPNDVWIFVGGGRTTAGAFDRALEAGLLQTGGGLSNFIATDSLKGDLAGMGTGASNGQLFTFGGKSGSADGTSASLCAGGGSCAALPDLQSGAFNALGSATTQRMYTASTQESAFFFLAGGHDGNATLATTERTVQ